MTGAGDGKSGEPCARFTAPVAFASADTSLIAESVKRRILLETRPYLELDFTEVHS